MSDAGLVFDQVMKSNLPWLADGTIYVVRHGSHAYGTNTATSDLDVRGVAIPPAPYFHGFMNVFEQYQASAPVDLTLFDIRKFFNLAADGNPNVLELLFVEEKDILFQNSLGMRLRSVRDEFLSKKVKFTLAGYAHGQLKRLKSHRSWLLNPIKEEPVRKDYGLPENTVVAADERGAVDALVDPSKELDAPGWAAAALKAGFSSSMIAVLAREKAYNQARREWEQYQNWKKTRNPARAALEAKYGFDCYAADTEFLTDSGWKLFDDVPADAQLATVYTGPQGTIRRHLGVEYQQPTYRFDSQYTGNMLHLTGHHTDTLVTPNHRMLLRPYSRRNDTSGTRWQLEEAARLPDCFEVLVAPTPRKKAYTYGTQFDKIPLSAKDYATLLGWYLSDGCAILREDGRVKSVRISQKLGGKLSAGMGRFQRVHGAAACSSLYAYERQPTALRATTITEQVLDIRHPVLAQMVVDDCGRIESKRVPRWMMAMPKIIMEALLDAALAGDGTVRQHQPHTWTYYSTLKPLADDIQELALMCGFETALWGPYVHETVAGTSTMYHVHVHKPAAQTRRFVRNNNVEVLPIATQRVVCFTVPNGTLITRRNGKVGIHGNCKHGMHLIRLSRMCTEVLKTGKLQVKRPDAEELLSIRDGAWSYERLIQEADTLEQEANALYDSKACPLPHHPDKKKLDAILCDLVEQHLVTTERA